ncbi:hypothetical protein ACHAXS_010519 [Conticribra weissflogii]
MINFSVTSSLLFLPFVLVQPRHSGHFFADAFTSYRPVACSNRFFLKTTALCSIHEGEHSSSISRNRRQVIGNVAATLLSSVSTLSISSLSNAEDVTAAGSNEGLVSATKLASLLKAIPTFAIVDARGVPYFVVGEDAKLTSYFFLSYNEAKRILKVAISSSDNAIKEGRKDLIAKKKAKGENGKLTKEEEEELGTNPWKNARITSVPLDLAVSLSSKGKIAGAYFRLAPSESDIEDALALDGSDDLPEGKVPLFYFEDMKISSAVGNNEQVSPLYFQKDQLISEWRRLNEGKPAPAVKVTELFATLTEMVRPNGIDSELKSIEFVPPIGSKSNADKIMKEDREPFRLGERLIVL